MILIGQYDSPFVPRVAVALNLYGIGFERRVLSVFADFDAMLRINPLGKVPVLQLDCTYMRHKLAALIAQRAHPALDQHCDRCEAMAPYRAAAYSAIQAQRSGWAAEAENAR